MDETVTKVIDTMEQEDAAIRTSIQEQAAAILAKLPPASSRLPIPPGASKLLMQTRQQAADQGRKLQALEMSLSNRQQPWPIPRPLLKPMKQG